MTGKKPSGTFTQYGFAKLLGISKQAVGAAIKKGRLELDSNKRIDPENSKTREFVAFHKGASQAAGAHGRGRPIAGGALPADQKKLADLVERNREDQKPQIETIAEHIKATDLNLKRIKAAKEQVFYHELIKKVIPFEIAARLFNMISNAMEQEFRDFDQKHTERIIDAVKSGKKKNEVAAIIRGEIEHGIQSVKKSANIAVNQLREEP